MKHLRIQRSGDQFINLLKEVRDLLSLTLPAASRIIKDGFAFAAEDHLVRKLGMICDRHNATLTVSDTPFSIQEHVQLKESGQAVAQLTMRDQFALAALAGHISNIGLHGAILEVTAGRAYEMADAMLKARKT